MFKKIGMFCVLILGFFPLYVYSQAIDRTHVNYRSPLQHGVTCNSTTLNAAITAIDAGSDVETLVLTRTDRSKVACTWTLNASVTTSTQVALHIPPGAMIDCNSQTVVINGPLEVGDYQVFTNCGSGLTINSPGYVFKPQHFGAVGDGTADDTTAIQDMCQVLETRGSGVADFGDKSYMIFKGQTSWTNDGDGHPTDIMCDLVNVDGVEIRSAGAVITNNGTMDTNGNRFAVFKLKTSDNVTIGDFKTTFTGSRTACDAQPANQITQCGGVFLLVQDLSSNITVGMLDINDFSVAAWFSNVVEAKGTASGSRDINIEHIKATTVGYGLLHRGAGHRINVKLNCDGCGRAAQLQGVLGPSVIHITSKDNIASNDVGMADDITDMDLTYVNTQTTELGTSRAVGVHYPPDDGTTDYTMKNVKVKLHIDLATGRMARCFTLGYSVGQSGAVDAGSNFYNIDVSGVCRNTSGSASSQAGFITEFPSSGWTESTNIHNINFHDIIMEGGGVNTLDWRALNGVGQLRNVLSDASLGLRAHTAGVTITVDSVEAPELFDATSDGEAFSIHVMNSTITTGSNFTMPTVARSVSHSILGGTFQNHITSQVSYQLQTLADDGTPTIAGGSLFRTGGTTAITDFDDGRVGQCIYIRADHTVTITDADGQLQLNGSTNFTMNVDDTLTLCMFEDQVWDEMGRKDDVL